MLVCRHFLLISLVFLLGVFIFGSVFAQTPVRPAWDSSSSLYAGVGIGYREGVRFFRDVSAELQAGTAPTFFVKPGTSLPGGLRLTDSGHLVGVPIGAGESSFTVVATNTAGAADKQVTLRLRGPFNNTHTQGDTHPDILDVQVFLNSTDCPITEAGPGSSGQETSYFGTKTQQALACYQRLHSFPVTNTLTPTLFQHFIQTYTSRFVPGDFTLPPGTTPLRAAQDVQGREHSFGSTHPDIRQVQVYLNDTPCPVAETGPGSPGQETAYFGTKTQQALTCYQRLHNLSITNTITPVLFARLAGITSEKDGVCDLAVSQGCTVGTPIQHEPSYISRGERWRCRGVDRGYSSDWCIRCDDGYSFDGRNCSRTVQGTPGARCSATTLSYCRLPRSAHDSSVAGACSAGRTGACQYACSNGTWQRVTNTCSLAQSDIQGHPLGSTHPDIRQAQVYLNGTPCPVAQTGAGSPGQETTYFGTKTQQALTCYQRLHNLPTTNTITSTLLTHLSAHYTPPTPNRPQTISAPQQPPSLPPPNPVLPQNGACDLTVSQGCTIGTPIQHEPSYISRGERWRCRGVNQGYSSDWCIRCDNGYSFDGRNCSRTAQGTPGARCSATTVSYCRLSRSAHGSSVAGVCSAGRTGACQYACSNGTWQRVTNTCSLAQPDDPNDVDLSDNGAAQPRMTQPQQRVGRSPQIGSQFGHAVDVGGNVSLRPCKMKRCCDPFCAADSNCRWCVECDELCTECDWHKLRCRKRVQTAIVGSHNAGAGSVYFYVRHEDRSGRIQWRLQERVVANDGRTDDAFGYAVALDEDVAVVGAPGDDRGKGAAYVFMRVFQDERVQWIQQEKLTAHDGVAGDEFGSAVAIDGATIAVGAYLEDPGTTPNAGAVYVFTRSGDAWSQEAKLTAVYEGGSDKGSGDNFGHSVAVTGNTLAVSAPRDEPRGVYRAGSVYRFTRQGTRWTWQEKIIADDRWSDDRFGEKVSIIGENCNGGNCCIPVDGRWSTVPLPYELPCGKVVKATCTSPAPSCGGSPCVGPPPESHGTQCGSGTCDIVTGQCKQGPCCGAHCKLGLTRCVTTIHGDVFCPRCASRAAQWVSPSCQGASAIRCAAKIPNTDGICIMGQSCDCQVTYCKGKPPVRECSGVGANCPGGSRTVVSTIRDDTFTGSAYIMSNGKQRKIVANDGSSQDRFGSAVAISERALIVGARDEDVGGTINSGAVYVFGTNGGQRFKLSADDRQRYNYFGQAASLYDTLMIIGAYGKNSYDGAAYIFTWLNGVWGQEVQLLEPDA